MVLFANNPIQSRNIAEVNYELLLSSSTTLSRPISPIFQNQIDYILLRDQFSTTVMYNMNRAVNMTLLNCLTNLNLPVA